MSTFAVITTSAVADGTRGALTRWMLEPAPGVYVGTLTNRVREYLWEAVCESIDDQEGWAALICNADNEQGYDIHTHGPGTRGRTIVDLDGLSLVSWTLTPDSDPEAEITKR
ncbi:CRISPR-associated protein, Cas2 family [Actinopolyspora xinjiangensis]|uniref:CRISPR-associated protein, Cas2 family n=1 Tax=Actinopolyspora xinjiangensis TaxID=405564 RepID=A0A1H0X0X2_9ACTN|nr:type I-E CRISPR-associated endoribonuclease Cas2e [Actinopolyspora xinjiangensis]SDP96499.1 CRISPR-associated protein, Cas2 family [Actinopolyspora xinjiangensis]